MPPKDGKQQVSSWIVVVLPLATMILGVLIALLAVWYFFPDAKVVDIGFEDGKSVRVRIEKDASIDYDVLLDSLFTDEWARAAAVSWLKSRFEIYPLTDPEVVNGLARRFPVSLRSRKETVLERHMRLDSLLNKELTIKDLRRAADRKDPPFQYVGRLVRIGVPHAGERPKEFYVNVPFESDFRGRRVELVNPRNQRRLKLLARAAVTNTDVVELFHLNENQAKYLFGRIAYTDTAVAIALPPGVVEKVVSLSPILDMQTTHSTALP